MSHSCSRESVGSRRKRRTRGFESSRFEVGSFPRNSKPVRISDTRILTNFCLLFYLQTERWPRPSRLSSELSIDWSRLKSTTTRLTFTRSSSSRDSTCVFGDQTIRLPKMLFQTVRRISSHRPALKSLTSVPFLFRCFRQGRSRAWRLSISRSSSLDSTRLSVSILC